MTRFLRRPGTWIALALTLAAGLALAVRARGPVVHVARVVRRDIEQHVVASGRVWVPTRVQVSAQVPGLVVAVAAIEGQRVKAGELLVQIDDSEARNAVSQVKAVVDQANARVEQLRRVGAIVATGTLVQAETNLARAQSELDRAERLFATGAIAEVELENARRGVELARAQRSAAEAQQVASAPMGADSRVALTALLQAQAQLAGAKVRLAQTRIVALQDGVVLTRSVEPGDVVQPSRTLLVLASGGDPQIVIQPDERNLAWIGLGQRARVAADAYPQQPFDAEVAYIAPSIDPQRGSVEVRLRAPNAPGVLKPDMTVSVDLAVASKAKVLTVPSAALRGAATASPWVYVVVHAHVVRRPVRIGIRGEGSTEVSSGLGEGDLVVLPDGAPLAPGQRVRAEAD